MTIFRVTLKIVFRSFFFCLLLSLKKSGAEVIVITSMQRFSLKIVQEPLNYIYLFFSTFLYENVKWNGRLCKSSHPISQQVFSPYSSQGFHISRTVCDSEFTRFQSPPGMAPSPRVVFTDTSGGGA